MAEYGSMFTVSGLAAILFFGGWNGPIPVFGPEALNLAYTPDETVAGAFRVGGYLANLVGCTNFIFKTVVGVTVMMWVRWTLPRLRIDQVMTTCLKYCVPLAAICFVGAVGWRLTGLWSPNDLAPSAHRGTVRESWVLEWQAEQAAEQTAKKAAADEDRGGAQ